MLGLLQPPIATVVFDPDLELLQVMRLEHELLMVTTAGKKPRMGQPLQCMVRIRSAVNQITHGEQPIHVSRKVDLFEQALQVIEHAMDVPDHEISPLDILIETHYWRRGLPFIEPEGARVLGDIQLRHGGTRSEGLCLPVDQVPHETTRTLLDEIQGDLEGLLRALIRIRDLGAASLGGKIQQ